MNLIKMDDEQYEHIKNKGIYIISGSEEILADITAHYDISNQILGIIRKAARKRGKILKFHGKTYMVYGPEILSQVKDVDDVAIIITHYRFKSVFDWIYSIKGVKESFNKIFYYTGASYREKYSKIPLQDLIIFRSGRGIAEFAKGFDFADNSRALFEYMLKEKLNDKYELIWLVDDPQGIDEKYTKYHNVRFLSFHMAISENLQERDEYYRILYSAKYIFFTENFTFTKNARRDQIRVQLWHGHGFKDPGMSVIEWQDEFEYMTVTSKFYGKMHQNIFGLRADQILVTGIPKEDWLYHPIEKWEEKLHVPLANKYIFWLPTCRTPASANSQHLKEVILHEETYLPILDSIDMITSLNEELKKKDIVLVIKLHPMEDQNAEIISKLHLSNIFMISGRTLMEEDIQINQILGHANALISDYSSVIVDYMLLNRPIGITLDDYEEYNQHRGFIFSNLNEYLPGSSLYNYEDFLQFVDDVYREVDPEKEKRDRLNHLFHDFHDDRNALRVLEVLGIKK